MNTNTNRSDGAARRFAGHRDDAALDVDSLDYADTDEAGYEYYEDTDSVSEGNWSSDADDPGAASGADILGASSPRSLGAVRSDYALGGHLPLISQSDVRSQELPPLMERRASRGARPGSLDGQDVRKSALTQGLANSGGVDASSYARTYLRYNVAEPCQQEQTQRAFRDSLPFTTLEPADYHATSPRIPAFSGSSAATSERPAKNGLGSAGYSVLNETTDPLLRRHSLNNTGDLGRTSPAYYASRSGVGHLRAPDEPRRTQRLREVVVARPERFEEVEQVAQALRAGNVVCLVLRSTRPELARRILDFAFGAAAALGGQVASPQNKIYLITCEYPLTPNEFELLQARGVL
ncbi:MAG: cell division protein SepF [Coriobacteriales bacterium]|nr:cell division protein SepF [Coriobacteriales bacterium]